MKTPHYFCENCGAEVRGDARLCPRCGRFFSSVKCPRCGTTGKASDFRAGCPTCGYSEAMNDAPEPIKPLEKPAPPLPLWTWIAGIVLFFTVLALLLRSLR